MDYSNKHVPPEIIAKAISGGTASNRKREAVLLEAQLPKIKPTGTEIIENILKGSINSVGVSTPMFDLGINVPVKKTRPNARYHLTNVSSCSEQKKRC